MKRRSAFDATGVAIGTAIGAAIIVSFTIGFGAVFGAAIGAVKVTEKARAWMAQMAPHHPECLTRGTEQERAAVAAWFDGVDATAILEDFRRDQ